MDGVGKSTTGLGDAVTAAHTPTLDKLLATCKNVYIKAHGTAVRSEEHTSELQSQR